MGLVRAVGIRLGGSAVVDTVIAISMTFYVRDHDPTLASHSR